MAEGIFNARAAERGSSATASSCGVAAFNQPACEYAVRAAAEHGADIGGHVSRKASEAIIKDADAVFAMTRSICEMLRTAYPEQREKIYTFSGKDVSDPYGGSMEEYSRTAGEIEAGVDVILLNIGEKDR
jgi:protein-tyrosine-phosphatase